MIWVTDAKYLEDYKISIDFNDGITGIVNLKEMINNDKRKLFTELKDINKFKDFEVDMDTIVWNNGLDLAPEYLYSLIKKRHKVSI